MRSAVQSNWLRPTLRGIAIFALVAFAIVWLRHAVALRHWRHEHGGNRQSMIRRLLGVREHVNVIRCSSNLRMWLFALYTYHDDEGALPHVRTPVENGASMHSWRSALLPYLEIPFASLYRYDEPWNGPHNEQFVDTPRQVECCPNCERTIGTGRTNYVVVVGPHCMWREDRGVSFDEITDDPAQTILLVEWPQSDVYFLEPRDLSVDQFLAMWADLETEWPHETEPPFLQTRGTLYMNVGMADGSIGRLPKDTSPETLKALLTIDGGESIDDPFLH